MDPKSLVENWFKKWEQGDFLNLPIADNFTHSSPFGTINGKKTYLDLISANKDKFLGYRFEIHDRIYQKDRACVRYTAIQGDFTLDVSEWYYCKGEFIESIHSYYHVGEIREERRLSTQ